MLLYDQIYLLTSCTKYLEIELLNNIDKDMQFYILLIYLFMIFIDLSMLSFSFAFYLLEVVLECLQ